MFCYYNGTNALAQIVYFIYVLPTWYLSVAMLIQFHVQSKTNINILQVSNNFCLIYLYIYTKFYMYQLTYIILICIIRVCERHYVNVCNGTAEFAVVCAGLFAPKPGYSKLSKLEAFVQWGIHRVQQGPYPPQLSERMLQADAGNNTGTARRSIHSRHEILCRGCITQEYTVMQK